jgi:hypothetical protein
MANEQNNKFTCENNNYSWPPKQFFTQKTKNMDSYAIKELQRYT